MLTERFEHCRKKNLKAMLDPEKMKKAWKKEVRSKLRNSILQDFHDYSDFHEQIDTHISSLRDRVLRGVYSPKKPLWYKEEKKMGVSRLLALPSPEDALLFQTVTDFLSEDLEDIQPVKNVFFSQLRHQPKPNLHEMENDGGYSRSKLYQKFARVSLGFAQSGRYVVTTDLSNFFDSVLISDLRHVVSQWFNHHEVELDLLFKMIDSFMLCPDYLPPRGRGIPTIDLDAPRFLGHVYLFEVDEVMDNLTSSNYTRWMDDIVFGANSYSEAKQILGKLNDLLRSRGLSLNLQKTNIYTPTDYIKSVMYDENIYLNDVFSRINSKKLNKRNKAKLARKWGELIKLNPRPRAWDKVVKRYLGAIKKSGEKFLDKDLAFVFFECPSTRDSLCEYLSHRGFFPDSVAQVKKALSSPHLSDDTALIHLVSAITTWDIPYTKEGRDFVKFVDDRLSNYPSELGRYAHIQFRSVHSARIELLRLIKENVGLISGDSFYARQLLCCIPLVYNENPKWCQRTLMSIAFERPGANSKLAQRLLQYGKGNFKLADVSRYLFYKLNGGNLKHSKLMFLISCLSGDRSNIKEDLMIRVFENVKTSSQLELILKVLD